MKLCRSRHCTTCVVRCPGNFKALCGPWKNKADDETQETPKLDMKDTMDGDDDTDGEAEAAPVGSTSIKKVFVCKQEASLEARRKKARGTCTIQQVEHMYMVCASSLCLPERPRKHYDGTNLGNVISPVMMRTSDWTASVKDSIML